MRTNFKVMKSAKTINAYLAILFMGSVLFTSCNSSKKASSSVSGKEKHENDSYAGYSRKLGFPVDKNCNKKLMETSASWLGVPYKYGGASKSGVDCSGLVCSIYKDVYGKQLPRTSTDMYDKYDKVKESNLKEGDLVFFNYDSKKVSHVGIYLKDDKFIHASTKKGVIIGDLNDPYNKKYFLRGGRVE